MDISNTPLYQSIVGQEFNISKDNRNLFNTSSRLANTNVTPRVIEMSEVDEEEESLSNLESSDSFHSCIQYSPPPMKDHTSPTSFSR